MTEMVPTRINDRWTLNLPKHRADRPGWPWWERDALHALWCLIRPGDVVWDIGAEEGDQSALYASWGARVLLVEPSPQAWPWIHATFEANELLNNVMASYCALVAPETTGFPDLGLARFESPAAGLWQNWPDAAAGPLIPDHGFRHLNEAVEDMPRIKLDHLARIPTKPDGFAAQEPDVVVMDIEGAEYQALLGAELLLHEIRPTWAISVHPEFMRERYGDTPDDLLVLMELAGYEARYLNYDHEQHWVFRPRP